MPPSRERHVSNVASHSLPQALFVGTGLVVALYIALNAVFLYTTTINVPAVR